MTLHVLHVLQNGQGGGIRQASELARHTVGLGGRATLAVPGTGAVPTALFPAAPEVTVRSLPAGKVARSLAITRLARAADLVHVHGARAAAWSLPALMLRPSVVTFHGLHPLRRSAGVLYTAGARRFLRAVTRLADAIVSVASTEAEELQALGVDPAKIHVVRNGVPFQRAVSEDEGRAARARFNLQDGRLAVLFLGRLDEPKDPLKAIRVVQALPEDEFVLLVAGDGPLMPLVAGERQENVRILGHRDDVRDLLAASDVVLSTSAWEGLPLALLEAMGAERPVVASDAAGNVEAVGEAGIIVANDDFDAFVEALLRLREPSLRRELARLGRERVQREFRVEAMLDATHDVYARVLRRKPVRKRARANTAPGRERECS